MKIFANCSRARVSQFFSQKVLRELWIKLYEGITKEVLFERCNKSDVKTGIRHDTGEERREQFCFVTYQLKKVFKLPVPAWFC